MIKEHIHEKRKEIRHKIVAIASHVFSKFGFKKATMEDIARASGMGKSSIYYYFTSKEEIFEAVVKKEAYQLSLELDQKVVNTHDNPKEKLRKYVLIRMRYLKEMVNFYETLKNDYLGNFAFTERVREKYDIEEQQIIQNILQVGLDQGLFKLKETKITAITLATALKGLESALLIKNEIDIQDLETHLDSMLEILFYGIVK
ncbi:MAG: TetR/AcrR family transcriptional regulator [Bacteroidales bacterium]|jgi:AcrR family transcriptional regulator|nr:TetR/AcrR family transcriptional regulator [Bacteroidales bacterium]